MSSPTVSDIQTGPRPENPFVGPVPFQPGQRLPNRQVEAQDVVDILLSERVLLLHAASGAGKTSLIQAEVLHRLDGYAVAGPVRVDKPVPAGADGQPVKLHNRYVFSIALYLLGNGQSPESIYDLSLAEVLRAALKPEGGTPLLIIDQFEEVLTLNPTDLADKNAFFEELGDAVEGLGEDQDGIWLLLGIKDEAVGGLEPYVQHLPGFLRARYRLSFLTPPEAKDAIQKPAADQQVTITDEAADELIGRLSLTRVRSPGQSAAESLPTTEVEPLLLQVVCRRLWRDLLRAKKAFDRIDLADIEKLPPDYVERALSGYYSDCIQDLAQEHKADEQTIRDWFETTLITEHGDRGQTTRGPITGPDAQKVLARLREMFLINSDTRAGTTWYELAHDRLVGPVRIANRTWRYRKLEPWQSQALDWKQHNRPPSLLLPPSQLPYKLGKDSPVEEEFRKACLAHYGSRFRLLRWQMLSVSVAVFALVELAIIVYLLFFR
jgi:hypothetical protein